MKIPDYIKRQVKVEAELHETRASLIGEAFLLRAYHPTGGKEDIDFCQRAAQYISGVMDVVKQGHGEQLQRMIDRDRAGESITIARLSRSEWQLCLCALNEAAGFVVDVLDGHPDEMPEVEAKLERFRMAKQHLVRAEIRTILKATKEMCADVGLPVAALLDFGPTREVIEETFDAARRVGVKEASLQRMLKEFAAGSAEGGNAS